MNGFSEMFSLAGKSALITGGSRGIGYAIAEGLLKAGARVYISSRKKEACEQARDELRPLGYVECIAADVSREDQCHALVDEVGDRESGQLNILVNNAGATWGASFDEFPAAAWDKIMAVNVKAPFMLTQRARPLLEKASDPADPSRVINIGSIDGLLVPGFGNYSYGASKAAIHHLTRHMAKELAPAVLVNAIAAGPFPTKMMQQPLADFGDELRAASPVKRVGEPHDIAATAIFLASRATTYMTGAVIPLDGGLSTTAGIQI